MRLKGLVFSFIEHKGYVLQYRYSKDGSYCHTRDSHPLIDPLPCCRVYYGKRDTVQCCVTRGDLAAAQL